MVENSSIDFLELRATHTEILCDFENTKRMQCRGSYRHQTKAHPSPDSDVRLMLIGWAKRQKGLYLRGYPPPVALKLWCIIYRRRTCHKIAF